jgi:hypothetical protein
MDDIERRLAAANSMTESELRRMAHFFAGYAPEAFDKFAREITPRDVYDAAVALEAHVGEAIDAVQAQVRAAAATVACAAKGAYGETCVLPGGHWGLHNGGDGPAMVADAGEATAAVTAVAE